MTDFDFASGDMQRCPNTEQKRRTLPKVPSFSDKRLFKEDDSLQTFSWPHGTRELIVERKRVHDILALNAKVKQPTDRQGYLGMDIPFEEAFIDSHDLRVELTDRLHTHYNANWKADIVSMHKCQPQNLFGAYHHAQGIVHATRDNLLEMQALYEDLRPETHALIKCCTSPMQLDKSMLVHVCGEDVLRPVVNEVLHRTKVGRHAKTRDDDEHVGVRVTDGGVGEERRGLPVRVCVVTPPPRDDGAVLVVDLVADVDADDEGVAVRC